MPKRLLLFWALMVSELNGVKLKTIHLRDLGGGRPRTTLCGVEGKKKGRKVEDAWWQMLPMNIPEVERRLRRQGQSLCPSCVSIVAKMEEERSGGKEEVEEEEDGKEETEGAEE